MSRTFILIVNDWWDTDYSGKKKDFCKIMLIDAVKPNFVHVMMNYVVL